MRRAFPLALVIACAKPAPTPAPAPTPIANDAKPKRHVLGLEDGAVWKFSGSYTSVNGTRPIEQTTKITRVDANLFTATSWPAYDPLNGIETELRIEDGVLFVNDDAWIRIEPEIESVACPADDYCWSVEPDGDGGFDIYYRTRPDVTVYHLVPGRGITNFSYHHNGYPPDDLKLHRE